MSILEYSQDISAQDAPPVLPAGEYPATIVAAEPKVSATSGNQYLALTLQISPDAYPPDFVDGDPDGLKLSYNRILLEDTPRSRWRLRNFFEKIGMAPPGRSFDTNDLLGRSVNARIKHGSFEGQTREEVDAVGS